MIRVLCVDDHSVVREGIARIISLQDDIEVVTEAATGTDGVKQFEHYRPDITLMDLQMPGMSGIETVEAIRHLDPEARVIVLTVYQGEEDIYRALQAGAICYLLKDTLPDELIGVIRTVHAGGSVMHPTVVSQLARRVGHPKLTEREQEVIRLLASGLGSGEIAEALGIARSTVQVHVRNIFEKLAVHDRIAAIRVAAERGLLRDFGSGDTLP